MEDLYGRVKAKYKSLVATLLDENAAIINTRSNVMFPDTLVFKKTKSIIPYIPTCTKSTFITVTPLNLFTKGDPILRYIPMVCNAQPSSIAWFEGTVFGTKAFDRDDMIDLLFVRLCEKSSRGKDALAFIRSKFGRTCDELVKPAPSKRRFPMAELFCSVCMVFECGIHPAHNPRILKYTERSECICQSRIKKGKFSGPFVDALDALPLDTLSLKPCVISEIAAKKYTQNISCTRIKQKTLPRKTVTLLRADGDARQFYTPCNHAGKCSDARCSCHARGALCGPACGCTTCNNVIFCSCKKCEHDCPCLKADRECSDFCVCNTERDCTQCNNRPITQRRQVKTSICKSDKHGLGLFAEEFIRADSFVMEYTGEVISDKEAERRGNFYEMNKLSYLFNAVMSGSECLYSLDAFFMGNKSRFINHSVSRANIRSKVLVSCGNVKVVFYSLRDIFKGEELLFDYKFTDEHREKHGIVD